MKHLLNTLSVMPFVGVAITHLQVNQTLTTVSLVIGILSAVIAICANISKL